MGPIGVGTTYQQVRSVPSRSEERLEITTYSPPRQLEIRGQLGPFASRLFYAPNTSPEGTRVTDESFKAGVALSAGWDGVSLLGGRGRPRSEEQGLGAGSPAAQLAP
jgi:hypothetical protein